MERWQGARVEIAPELPAGAPLDLEGYIALALTDHPELGAQHERWRSAIEITGAQRALPDPVITAMIAPSPIETRHGPQRARLGVSQMIPWPGALGAQWAAALKEADLEGGAL